MEIQSIKNRFDIIGNDPQLNYALQVASQVASTDLSVLVYGESGVGKEVFSKVIHSLSSRKHNSFIAVNCGAIPEGTIDSELFGHEKGAFTSASDSRKGYFETVNGGTIFLDEIGELPIGTQARLLRVLESGEFIKVGSSKVLKTNVRVVAATNKDLLDLTKEGSFREDLYYRLNTVPIIVPPLRERQGDIAILFKKFAHDFAQKYRRKMVQLTPNALDLISNYSFPGNVRELKNIAEQVSVLSQEAKVDAVELSKFLPKEKGVTDKGLALYTHQAPTFNPAKEQQEATSSDRELLYKVIFDLKKEISDIKLMLCQLGGSVPSAKEPYVSGRPKSATPALPMLPNHDEGVYNTAPIAGYQKGGDVVLHTNPEDYDAVEHVEESLSLEDMEKTLIEKALKKHKGKRKDAALELGISDRTLYRKIKDYDIDL